MTIPQSVGSRRLADLPPTQFQIENERHRLTVEENDLRERVRVREFNAAPENGAWEEPQPGDVMYVQLDGTLVHRNRSGLRFERGKRIAVIVIAGSDEEVRAKQQRGYTERGIQVVSIYGAERLIEDKSLHKYKSPLAPDELDALKRDNAEKEEALRLAQDELRALKAQMAEARRGAKSTGDGRPAKLNAQAAVATAAGTTPGAIAAKSEQLGDTGDHEFGAPPPGEAGK